MACLVCPHCRLSVRTRFPSLPVQCCPRCLARRHRWVELQDRDAPTSVIDRGHGEILGPGASEDTIAGCLHVAVRTVGKTGFIDLAGELDLSNVAALQAAIAQADRSIDGLVVIDLGGLEFIDVSGMRALMVADASLDGRLRLLRAHGAVRRLFELAGMLDRLPFAPRPLVISSQHNQVDVCSSSTIAA